MISRSGQIKLVPNISSLQNNKIKPIFFVIKHANVNISRAPTVLEKENLCPKHSCLAISLKNQKEIVSWIMLEIMVLNNSQMVLKKGISTSRAL
jgi:hypothetical protein